MQAVSEFFHALWRQLTQVWDILATYLTSIFDPQAGWPPKAIFGGVLLLVVFWISKRGTKS